MPNTAPPVRRGLPWRLASMAVMGTVGAISRGFLYGLNNVEVIGLNRLLEALDRRKNGRERGLLTICNHVSVLDDPLLWGILPLRYTTDIENFRWALGAHDICFKNRFLSTFFSLGQVLPTHRLQHSPSGGLYQPTITQAIRLLSNPRQGSPPPSTLSFSTNGADSYPAPAAFKANCPAWLHIFPEACCHQSPHSGLRYFKWGVSRLILESQPAPELVPIFIHGTHAIMPEERRWPRWMPRFGNRLKVVIGEPTDSGLLFGKQRAAWNLLASNDNPDVIVRCSEADRLRIEVARCARDQVQRLRESIGFFPEPNTTGLAESWSRLKS